MDDRRKHFIIWWPTLAFDANNITGENYIWFIRGNEKLSRYLYKSQQSSFYSGSMSEKTYAPFYRLMHNMNRDYPREESISFHKELDLPNGWTEEDAKLFGWPILTCTFLPRDKIFVWT